MSRPKLTIDPAEYGSRGHNWHPEFVKYMVKMVSHPVYAGMPDAIKEDGKIQWEAPSNRSAGTYQHTHHRRRVWWEKKAREIGLDVESDGWISKTAKNIHPYGEKPCKRCGRILRLDYVYPNRHLQRRLVRLFGSDFEYDQLEPITNLVSLIHDAFGEEGLYKCSELLRTRTVSTPSDLNSLDSWLHWLEEGYIPTEPSLLSPGAMSNAPDRFDGFHSFNLCCRAKADTGRHRQSMRLYSTDRRVFEYWSEGDWIAADRLMGLVRAKFKDEPCADDGEGPATADHIGPLSLGFKHRPCFRLLSRQANSAKNNRMTLEDVQDLIEAEVDGERVASWFAEPLWKLRKSDVDSPEKALRLSKLLRDNQRAAMMLLQILLKKGKLTFLASLLGLDYANSNVTFEDLEVRDFVTYYASVVHTLRETRYATEQKARRVRIGFTSLASYGTRENRHKAILEVVLNSVARQELGHAIRVLDSVPKSISDLDSHLGKLLLDGDARRIEHTLRGVVEDIPKTEDVPQFGMAFNYLHNAMVAVSRNISRLWDDERYVRDTSMEDWE